MRALLKDPGVALLLALAAGTGVYYAWAFKWVELPRLSWSESVPWALAGAAALALLVALVLVLKNAALERRRRAINAAVAVGPTTILLPRSGSDSVDVAGVRFWDQIAAHLPGDNPTEHVAWEVSGNGDGQRFSTRMSAALAAQVMNTVQTEWPTSERRSCGSPARLGPPDPIESAAMALRHCFWLELAPVSQAPIRVTTDDPLRKVLMDLNTLPADMVGVVQVLARRDAGTQRELRQKAAQMRSGAAKAEVGTRVEANKMAKESDKRSERAFLEVVVRVAVFGTHGEMTQSRAAALSGTVKAAFDPSNPLIVVGQGREQTGVLERAWLSRGRPWGSGEIGLLAHLPGGDVVDQLPRLEKASALNLPIDPKMRIGSDDRIAPFVSGRFPIPSDLQDLHGQPKIILGSALDQAGNRQFAGFTLSDLKTHATVVGTTGSGKSVTLANLALQAYALGSTAVVLDPHGALAEACIAGVHPDGIDDVVLLDPAQRVVICWSLLTTGLKHGLDMAVDAAMSALRQADPSNWDQSGQMQDLMRHALRVLIQVEGDQASMVKLDRFFNKSQYRAGILKRAARIREVRRSADYWLERVVPLLEPERRKEKKGAGGADSLKQSLVSANRRLSTFVNDKKIRRTLSIAPIGSTLDLGRLLSSQKLVLIPVRKSGELGLGEKGWALVLNLVMGNISTELLGRDFKDNQQVVVIVDEAASMRDLEVVDYADVILREARKFGGCLVLGTQSLVQLPSEVAQNIRINANQKVVLKVSDAEDAKASARMLGDPRVTGDSIQNATDFRGYVKSIAATDPALLQMLDAIRLTGAPRPHPRQEPFEIAPSDAFLKVMALAPALKDTQPNSNRAVERVLDFLERLEHDDFERVTDDVRSVGEFLAAWLVEDPTTLVATLRADPTSRAAVWATRLLDDPESALDHVSRARMISGARFGYPWWLLEGKFLREDEAAPGLATDSESFDRDYSQAMPEVSESTEGEF